MYQAIKSITRTNINSDLLLLLLLDEEEGRIVNVTHDSIYSFQ